MMSDRTYYTDGACSGNPGPGGWCYVELDPCEEGYKTKCVTGNKALTTNGEMELMAAYMAMVHSMKEGYRNISIYSDSKYVVDAIEKGWLRGWTKNGWKTAGGKEVKNRAIWEKVHKLTTEMRINVRMHLVKGHDGNALNELANDKAIEARKEIDP